MVQKDALSRNYGSVDPRRPRSFCTTRVRECGRNTVFGDEFAVEQTAEVLWRNSFMCLANGMVIMLVFSLIGGFAELILRRVQRLEDIPCIVKDTHRVNCGE